MLILAIEATNDGQHYFESQSHRTEVWMEGYVAVPPERESEVMGCVGYGDLMVEDGKFVDFVPHPERIPAPAEPEPSQLDVIEAQVTYTAMMTDTLLEV